MTTEAPLEGEVLGTVELPRTDKERAIASALARGYSWNETARVAECSRSTVQRAVERLSPYIRQLRAQLNATLEQDVYGNLALALDVERRMLVGEIEVTEGRYLEARKIIDRALSRLTFVEPPPRQAEPLQLEAPQ